MSGGWELGPGGGAMLGGRQLGPGGGGHSLDGLAGLRRGLLPLTPPLTGWVRRGAGGAIRLGCKEIKVNHQISRIQVVIHISISKIFLR